MSSVLEHTGIGVRAPGLTSAPRCLPVAGVELPEPTSRRSPSDGCQSSYRTRRAVRC